MGIIIKEVVGKKDLKKWVDFPNKLYKKVPAYVPFLFNDEMDTFTKAKNPAYDFCETKLFLAYIDNKIVGRIGALINHAYNKKWNKNAMRFTRFDFIDDYEVSEALFNEVIKWAKENNLTEVMGPIGFTDLDHEGMLVEGFDEKRGLYLGRDRYNRMGYVKSDKNLIGEFITMKVERVNGVSLFGQIRSSRFSKHIKDQFSVRHIVTEIFFLQSFKLLIFFCRLFSPCLLNYIR